MKNVRILVYRLINNGYLLVFIMVVENNDICFKFYCVCFEIIFI